VLAKGYGAADIRADLMAVWWSASWRCRCRWRSRSPSACPLSTACTLPSSRARPSRCSVGCKFQVTGPTAAFVVILAPIVTKHGVSGLLMAGFLAGILLVAMGVARLGSLIQYIPYPVTTGFTTGIATVIATLQIKDALGLQVGPLPEHYVERVVALWDARGSACLTEFAVAGATLALLLLVPRAIKKIPAPLIALGLVAAAVSGLFRALSCFCHRHDRLPFSHGRAWRHGGRDPRARPVAGPAVGLCWAHVRLDSRAFFRPRSRSRCWGAIRIAALGGHRGRHDEHEARPQCRAGGPRNRESARHRYSAESPRPVPWLERPRTSVPVRGRRSHRSPTRSSCCSRFSFLAPLVAYIPMASLAALLLLVAWNMSEVHHFIGLVRVAPKGDVFVLGTCFVLTVFFDMVIAVSVGFVLAAILFMRRMSELTESRLELDASREGGSMGLPAGVIMYEINGPLFFGAAQKAMGALNAYRGTDFRVLIIHLGRVPAIDATGFVALEHAIADVLRSKKRVILAGPLPRPHSIFEHAKLEAKHVGLSIARDLPAASRLAEDLMSSEGKYALV